MPALALAFLRSTSPRSEADDALIDRDATLHRERRAEARVRRRRFQRSVAPAGDADPHPRGDGQLAAPLQMDTGAVAAFPRRPPRHARPRRDRNSGSRPVEPRAARARRDRACRSSELSAISPRRLVRRRDRRDADHARLSRPRPHALELRVHARTQAVEHRHGQMGAPHPRQRHQGHARGDDRRALPERSRQRVPPLVHRRIGEDRMPISSAASDR